MLDSHDELLEKFLSFCDRHQLFLKNVNIVIYAVAATLMLIFNNKNYGFEGTLNGNIRAVIPTFIFYSMMYFLRSENKTRTRIITLVHIMYIANSSMVLLGGLYHIFIGAMTFEQAVLFVTPLLLFVALIICKIMLILLDNSSINVNIIKNAVKSFINIYFKK